RSATGRRGEKTLEPRPAGSRADRRGGGLLVSHHRGARRCAPPAGLSSRSRRYYRLRRRVSWSLCSGLRRRADTSRLHPVRGGGGGHQGDSSRRPVRDSNASGRRRISAERGLFMKESLVRELEEGLAEIPVLDIHTHLVGGRLGARGLSDILLYHM